MFSVIQVFDKLVTVKCQDNLDYTYRLYKRILFFGCKGFESISFIRSSTSSIVPTYVVHQTYNRSICSSLVDSLDVRRKKLKCVFLYKVLNRISALCLR